MIVQNGYSKIKILYFEINSKNAILSKNFRNFYTEKGLNI